METKNLISYKYFQVEKYPLMNDLYVFGETALYMFLSLPGLRCHPYFMMHVAKMVYVIGCH